MLFAWMNRIAMNLELVRPIFEVVFLTDNCPRQLAGFANRYESGTCPISDRRTEDEPPGLDTDNPIDLGTPANLLRPWRRPLGRALPNRPAEGVMSRNVTPATG